MNRNQLIHNTLKDAMQSLNYDVLSSGDIESFTATGIGEKLNLSRSSISLELNKLSKDGKLIYIKSRPVIFFDKKLFNEKFSVNIKKDKFNSLKELVELIEKKRISEANRDDNEFGIIGLNGSLKKIADQGRAAILYPPNGLHILLLGSTGVGKSLFAEYLYKFAIKIGRYTDKTKFVVFNCADYANNPQLLMSHLFGHAKGAFTGADDNKKGLIEAADGGILFLDEVHRLPSEGQEMLFSIMDHGIYRRLGETVTNRKSNVLLITATTENVNSSLLKTFTRRIPVILRIPDIRERHLSEREELVKYFFNIEGKRINENIIIDREVIWCFMLYDCKGNIGELKSDIQKVCANAYHSYISKGDKAMKIGKKDIPQEMVNILYKVYEYWNILNNNDSNRISEPWQSNLYNTKTDVRMTYINTEIVDSNKINIRQYCEKFLELIGYEYNYSEIISKIEEYKEISYDDIDKFSGVLLGCLQEYSTIKWEDEFQKYLIIYLLYLLNYNNEINLNIKISNNSYFNTLAKIISKIIDTNFNLEISTLNVSILATLMYNFLKIDTILVEEGMNKSQDNDEVSNKTLEHTVEYIEQTIVYVNPKKLCPLVYKIINLMQFDLKRRFTLDIMVKLMIHISFAVERLINDEYIKHTEITSLEDDIELCDAIKRNLWAIEEQFNIDFNIDEIQYIKDILE
ncbi:sigma 54-interacting transcriptional regulator [Clostridium sp. NSJ-6]|uniref:Sigma 54-interacting transcriptional regulator n=1 Tax=Clostridium hominis TaxID=2763036 RepID=A0ABR7DGA5_9CLOT|nr:sigma 54-interacting transcriptional regulator [Clostridium hominis]